MPDALQPDELEPPAASDPVAAEEREQLPKPQRSLAPESLHRGWRWFRWRGLAFVATYLLALIPLCLGVATTDRPNIPDAPLVAKVYYALGLFVLGGLDLGVPAGGPPAARGMLWIAFFLAPAITTSALVEAVLLVLRPHDWRMRRMRGHIVVIGCGHLALLYLERLRQHNPQQPVLVVEKRLDKPNTQVAAVRYRAEVLYGDVSHETVLNSLRLQHADRVVLLTGNDFVNLDTAARICQKVPRLASHVLLHVADTRLRQAVDQQAVLGACATFNSHERAAGQLVQEKLLPHFRQTAAPDVVVLAGFGRFGQTVLDQLQHRAAGKFGTVVLVDLDAEGRALEFEEQFGFQTNYQLERIDGDLRQPRTWKRLEPFFKQADQELVLLLGTDDAGTNILTALWLSQRFPHAYVVARCFYHSSFTEQVSRQGNFEIYSFADLLLANMEPRWFAPPGETDLTRVSTS